MKRPYERAPAETEATSKLIHFQDTTETAIGSPVSFQAELDLLDTINSVQLVIEAYATGQLADLEAVSIMGRAVQRKAHHVQVARINRPNIP